MKGRGLGGSRETTEMAPRRELGSHADRRARAERRMLDAAVRLIAEHGVDGVTLSQVGEAAGYSRGLPAHYFGRKDVLVAAAARHIVSGFLLARTRRQAGAPDRGLAGLLNAADHYLAAVERDPTTMRALLRLQSEAHGRPLLLAATVELNATSAADCARRIREGQADGEIDPDADPDASGVLIIGQLRGAAAQWLVDPGSIAMDGLRAAMRRSLSRSLGR